MAHCGSPGYVKVGSAAGDGFSALARWDAANGVLADASGEPLAAAAGLLSRLCRTPEIIPAIRNGKHTSTATASPAFFPVLVGIFCAPRCWLNSVPPRAVRPIGYSNQGT